MNYKWLRKNIFYNKKKTLFKNKLFKFVVSFVQSYLETIRYSRSLSLSINVIVKSRVQLLIVLIKTNYIKKSALIIVKRIIHIMVLQLFPYQFCFFPCNAEADAPGTLYFYTR